MKNLLLSFLFLPLAFHANAQHFKAGLTVGLAATQVDGDSHGGYNKVGPIAGFWVQRNMSSSWFGRLEFRYIQKGSYAKSENDGGSTFYRIRLNYFELPVFAGYKFINGITVLGGVSVGYLAQAQEMDESGSFPSEDISYFRKYEVAGIAGFEYNYSERWAFGTFFSYSIFPIRPYNDNISYRLNYGQYNRVIEFVAKFKLQ